MLTHLQIRDFAIIDAVELELRSGLTVLTGETGAGKSIVVDALPLLAGAGLSGEHREAGAQLELDGINDGEVAYLQVRQHAQCSKLPRPQRSFERSSR